MLAGDVLVFKSKITQAYKRMGKLGGKNYIEAEVFAENQRGEKVITGSIVAEVLSKSAA
ncbi:MAG: MaoC family dehydratase N-terminal domain-containing protein [Proteobacteria bacterium]|nr:MaoC family dehydratase N-terminal domain-containing protein [Pseudomonadota bacterium]